MIGFLCAMAASICTSLYWVRRTIAGGTRAHPLVIGMVPGVVLGTIVGLIGEVQSGAHAGEFASVALDAILMPAVIAGVGALAGVIIGAGIADWFWPMKK